jgi:hypothetical protein
MPQQVPQIPEADAPPEIAAIYDEMRRVMRLPMVNLIYRHMATMPGALPWVWSLIRPQLIAGRIEAAANRMVAALDPPALGVFRVAELRSAGLDAADQAIAARVVAAYNRGNSLNMMNLTAVRLALDVPSLPRQPRPAAPAPTSEPPAIPPIRRLDQLAPDTAARLTEIAGLHGGAGVLPSLYLHLANWPGFLALACERLAPALRDGSVSRASDAVYRLAADEAPALVALFATDVTYPAAHAAALRAALDSFTRRLIPEMVPVGLALSHALPA